MNWLNNFFTNITVTNNISFNDGFISNGDGTFTNQPGFFLYSGTPAAGNLITSITANAGSDIFGNNFLGNGDTQYDNALHEAVQLSGGTIKFWTFTPNPGAVFTSAPFVLNQNMSFSNGFISNGDGTFTNQPGIFLYSGTPAAGNLIFSSTGSVTGHDKFNNNFIAGTTSYDPVTNLSAVQLQGGLVTFYTMTAQPNSTFASNSDIASTPGPLAGQMQIDSASLPVTLVVGSSHVSFQPALNGELFLSNTQDGNNLYCGAAPFTSSGGQNINTTTFTVIKTINLLTTTPSYRIKGWMLITSAQNANSFAAKFSGGTAVIGHARGYFRWTKTGGATPPSTMTNIDGTINNAFLGTFAAVGEVWVADFDFFFPVTTAGSLTLVGAMNVAAGGVTINGLDFSLEPFGD